jgi:hypothetical protein
VSLFLIESYMIIMLLEVESSARRLTVYKSPARRIGLSIITVLSADNQSIDQSVNQLISQ